MDFPKDILYTKEHEWVRFDKKTGQCTIGITDYAQDKLGDLVHVELPDEDEDIRANEPFGSVESVKAVSDIYSPVSGKIIEFNSVLEESPELLNEDPYEEGWILKLKVSDTSPLDDLMNAKEYEEFIHSEE